MSLAFARLVENSLRAQVTSTKLFDAIWFHGFVLFKAAICVICTNVLGSHQSFLNEPEYSVFNYAHVKAVACCFASSLHNVSSSWWSKAFPKY